MAKKTGLGKGLNSLISEASVETGMTENVTEVSIDMVKPNPEQPRRHFDEEALAELSDSISKVGILQPLLVKSSKDGYLIIAGERRYQAALRANLKTVPIIVREADEKQTIELALIENLQRSDLNPIEEAMGYKKLLDYENLTQEALAQAVSKSRSAIANSLRLLDLPETVQQFLYDGKISAGHARAILAVPDDERRIKLAEKVISDKLSVRQTEALAPLFSVDHMVKPDRQPTPRSFKVAAQQLRQTLDTNVRVKSVRGKNKIEIEFKDEEELAKILEKIH